MPCKLWRTMISVLSKPASWSRWLSFNSPHSRSVDFSPLPLDVLLEIIQWLDVEDIHRLRLVNKRLNEVTHMPVIWKRFIRERRRTHVLPAVPPSTSMLSLSPTQAEAMVIRSLNFDSNFSSSRPDPAISQLASPFTMTDAVFLPGGRHLVTLSKADDENQGVLLFDLSVPDAGKRQHVAMYPVTIIPARMQVKYMRVEGSWGITVALCWAPQQGKTEYAVLHIALATVESSSAHLRSRSNKNPHIIWNDLSNIAQFTRVYRHRTLQQIGDMSLGEVAGRPMLAIVRRPRTITLHELDTQSDMTVTLKLDGVVPNMQHSIAKIKLLQNLHQILVIRLLFTDSAVHHVFEIYELPHELSSPAFVPERSRRRPGSAGSRHQQQQGHRVPPAPPPEPINTTSQPRLLAREIIRLSSPPNDVVTFASFYISEPTGDHYPHEPPSSSLDEKSDPPEAITISACTSVPPGIVQWVVPVVRRSLNGEGREEGDGKGRKKKKSKKPRSKNSLSSLFARAISHSPPASPPPSPPSSKSPSAQAPPKPEYYYRFPPQLINRSELPLGVYPWAAGLIVPGKWRSLWVLASKDPRVMAFFAWETVRRANKVYEDDETVEGDGMEADYNSRTRPHTLTLPDVVTESLDPATLSVTFDETSGKMLLCDGQRFTPPEEPRTLATHHHHANNRRGMYSSAHSARPGGTNVWLVDYGLKRSRGGPEFV